METTQYSYTSEHPSIFDVASEETHNLALLYANSSANEWRAMAFQTNMTVRRAEYVTEITTLNDATALDFGMLSENGHTGLTGTDAKPGEDRLRVDNDRNQTIIEYGIGVEPDDVHVGVENPSGSHILGIQGERTRGFDSEELPERGSVKSQLTTTTDGVPTTALSTSPEQGIVRFDSDEDGYNPTRVGFYNESGGTATIDVTLMGMTYHVTPITDSETVRDMVWGQGYNRRVLTYGGFDNTSPNLPSEWVDGRVALTSDDAREIIQNR